MYTYGSSTALPTVPIVAGFSVCEEADVDVAVADGGLGLYSCSRQGSNSRARCAVAAGGTNADCGAARTDADCTAATASGGGGASANDCVFTADCQTSGVWTDAPANTVCTAPEDRDLARTGADGGANVAPGYCTHAIDQGAICISSTDRGMLKCQTHNGVPDANCDDWHHCASGCQTCGGCGFGCASVDAVHPQDVIFGCVEYASVECTYDVSGADAAGFSDALAQFASCATNGETAGYCRGSLASAALLSNQDVCAGPIGADGVATGASNSNASTYAIPTLMLPRSISDRLFPFSDRFPHPHPLPCQPAGHLQLPLSRGLRTWFFHRCRWH